LVGKHFSKGKFFQRANIQKFFLFAGDGREFYKDQRLLNAWHLASGWLSSKERYQKLTARQYGSLRVLFESISESSLVALVLSMIANQLKF
jgi:hypothetical protein